MGLLTSHNKLVNKIGLYQGEFSYTYLQNEMKVGKKKTSPGKKTQPNFFSRHKMAPHIRHNHQMALTFILIGATSYNRSDDDVSHMADVTENGASTV